MSRAKNKKEELVLAKKIKRFAVFLLVFQLVISLFTPVYAAETVANGIVEKIEEFNIEFVSGGEPADTANIWRTGDNYKEGHKFVYKINYALSGDGMLPVNSLVIRFPKSIIKDREGNPADKYDVAVPKEEEIDLFNSFSKLGLREDGDFLVVYNRREISAAESGNFEVAYATTQTTYNYVDSALQDEMFATLSVPGVDDTQLKREVFAKSPMIDSQLVIRSVSKNAIKTKDRDENYIAVLEWDPKWMSSDNAPENPDDYYYMEWDITTNVTGTTAKYNFEIVDNFLCPDGEVVGYMLDGRLKYSHSNTDTGCSGDKTRHDRVLTRHPKEKFKDLEYYTVNNSVNVKLSSFDGTDPDVEAGADSEYEYQVPEYTYPNGLFWSDKYGYTGVDFSHGYYTSNKDYHFVKTSEDVSSFELGEFVDGEIDQVTVPYYAGLTGRPFPYIIDDGADWSDPTNFGTRKVKYEYTDKWLYLNQMPEDFRQNRAVQLGYENYDFYGFYFDYRFRKGDPFAKASWEPNGNGQTPEQNGELYEDSEFDDDDLIELEGMLADETWVRLATYKLKTREFTYTNPTYVKEVFGRHISFNPGIKGWRLTNENSFIHSLIDCWPQVALYRNQFTLNSIGDELMARLSNQSELKVFTDRDQMVYDRLSTGSDATDYIVKVHKQSDAKLSISGTVNNKDASRVDITYSGFAKEYYVDKEGSHNSSQIGGTYYLLLPKGSIFDKKTLKLRDMKTGDLITDYDLHVTENFRNSGRPMVEIKMYEGAMNYSFTYVLHYPWSSIKDCGNNLKSSFAYETWNSSYADGFADDGGDNSDKELLTDLDPETDANKFIYAERSYDVSVVTAADVGLTKTVKSNYNADYSDHAIATNDSIYTYRLRLSNGSTTKSKDIVFYDSLENFDPGRPADWKGTIENIDLNNLIDNGVEPVLYYSAIDNIDIYDHHNLTETINGSPVWVKASDFTGTPKAIAIDCRRGVDGEDFILEKGKSMSAYINMRVPAAAIINDGKSETYNGVFVDEITINEFGENIRNLYHHDHTTVEYRVMGNVRLRKVSSSDENIVIPGVVFNLQGTSEYGTEYDVTATTGKNGELVFEDIEYGDYIVKEISTTNDYVADYRARDVSIDAYGHASSESMNLSNNRFIVENEPRIHTNIKFSKQDLVTKRKLENATLRLTGKSDYDREYDLVAKTNAAGEAVFNDIERGTYELVETVAPSGYVLDKTKRRVVVDSEGNVTIDGLEKNDNEEFVFYNVHLYELNIQKQDAESKMRLENVEFNLKGTADDGTYYDETKRTDNNGNLKFENLRKGSYVLKETETDERYVLDDRNRVVTVTDTGKITISGLAETDGKFIVENQRALNGQIKVVKNWRDGLTNAERDVVPSVHISRNDPSYDKSVVFLDRNKFMTTMPNSGGKRTLKKFERAENLSKEEVLAKENVIKIDDGITGYSFYAWPDYVDLEDVPEENENFDLYWWSDAETIYFPTDSSSLFTNAKWRYLDTLDLEDFDTSRVEYAGGMFRWCYGVKNIKCSSWNMSRCTDMNYMFSECRELRTLPIEDWDVSHCMYFHWMFYDCRNMINLDVSKWDTSCATSFEAMFRYDINLTTIDVSQWNTSSVRTTREMFRDCKKVVNLDLHNWDMRACSDAAFMFYYCTALKNINTTGLVFDNLRNANQMFYNCYSLLSLDVSSFDLRNLWDARSMFAACSKITTLDLESWNISHLVYADSMFSGCTLIADINAVRGWDLSELVSCPSMFQNCKSITYVDLHDLNTEKCQNFNNMFYNCTALISANLAGTDFSDAQYFSNVFYGCSALTSVDFTDIDFKNILNLSYLFYNCQKLSSITLEKWDFASCYDSSYMFYNCKLLEDVANMQISGFGIRNMSYMFSGCSKLRTVNTRNWHMTNTVYLSGLFNGCTSINGLDVSLWDVSHVVRFNSLIQNCTSLDEFDVSEWDVSMGKNFNNMFYNCTKLANIEIDDWDMSSAHYVENMFYGCLVEQLNVDDWDVSNIHTFVSMFQNCKYLRVLNVSGWIPSSGQKFNNMFNNCNALTSIGVSGWDMSKARYIDGMFANCTSMTSININGWNIPDLYSMTSLFSGCVKLQSVDLSNWDISRVRSLSSIFYNCQLLDTVNISTWNTAMCNAFNSMFYNCKSLETLDLSSWKFYDVTNVSYMFEGCISLTTIYASDELRPSSYLVSSANYYRNMFNNCRVLIGGNGTRYSTNAYTNALIDNNEHAGYFTYKQPAVNYDYVSYVFASTNSLFRIGKVEEITKIQRNTELTEEEVLALGDASLTDNPITIYSRGSTWNEKKLYVWRSGTVVYWWTNADKVYLTSASGVIRDMLVLTNVDMSIFDFTYCTSLNYAFYRTPKLTELLLGDMSYNQVTDMAGMLRGTTVDLDISSWDSSMATTLYEAFRESNKFTHFGVEDWDVSNVTNMTYMFYATKCNTKTDLSSWNTSNVESFQQAFYATTAVQVETTFDWDMRTASNITYIYQSTTLPDDMVLRWKNVSAEDFSGLFQGSNIKTFSFSEINATYIRSIYAIFNGCQKLTSVDFTGTNFRSTTDTSYAFQNCKALTSINLSEIDFPNNRNTSYMFNGCGALQQVHLGNVLGKYVYASNYMFSGCGKLASCIGTADECCAIREANNMFSACYLLPSLDLSNTTFDSVYTATSMFQNCRVLPNLDQVDASFNKLAYATSLYNNCRIMRTIQNIDSDCLYNIDSMFNECYVMENIDLSDSNMDYVTLASSMFSNCQKLLSVTFPDNIDTSRWVFLNSLFYNCYILPSVDTGTWNLENAREAASIFQSCRAIEHIDLKNAHFEKTRTSGSLFNGCTNLKTINLNGSSFEYNISTGSMFYNCTSLEQVALSFLNIKHASTTSSMFYNTPLLTDIGKTKIELKDVYDMTSMFYNCGLPVLKLDFTGIWQLRNMNSLFEGAKIEDVTFRNFNIEYVRSFYRMFYNCKNLTSEGIQPSLSKFDTSKITSFSQMFYGASALTSLDLSTWDTSKVTNMNTLFAYCSSLTDLNLLGWDTSKVTTMESMFYGCNAIEVIDLSSFEVTTSCYIRTMFYYLESLKTIYASKDWTPASNSAHVFAYVPLLVGGNGSNTSNVSNSNNMMYAKLDNEEHKGYFTKKAAPVANSAQYDSVDENWVKISDDTWVYTFNVFDDEALYYCWEDQLADYSSDAYESDNRTINNGTITKSISIINAKQIEDLPEAEPDIPVPASDTKYGYIEISKTVLGDVFRDENGKAKETFFFDVNLVDVIGEEDYISGTRVYSNYVFENGHAVVSLKDGELIQIRVPIGLTFAVSEQTPNFYDVESTGTVGTIEEEQISSVSFVNTYNKQVEYGRLTVAKTVSGEYAGESFDFTLDLTGLDPMSYIDIQNQILMADVNGMLSYDFSLSNGESITFDELPADTKYKVTEYPSDYVASYSVLSNDRIHKSKDSNENDNMSLSTAWETVYVGSDAELTYTNTKQVKEVFKSILVEKQWVNDTSASRPSDITLMLYQNGDLYRTQTISEEDGWTYLFDELPEKDDNDEIYEYSVKEYFVEGYTVQYLPNENGDYVKIINTKVLSGSISVNKKIVGPNIDPNKVFTFVLELDSEDANYTFTGTKSGTITLRSGQAMFSLKHNDSILIENLPTGVAYRIYEKTLKDYVVSPENGYSGLVPNGTTDVCSFENTYSEIGDLNITKYVVSTDPDDYETRYNFHMSLSEWGSPISGTFETNQGTITFVNGESDFTLQHNETLSIKDLPIGYDYVITEERIDKFDVVAVNDVGRTARGHKDVSFKNMNWTILPITGGIGFVFYAFPLLLIVVGIIGHKKHKKHKE